MLFRSDHTNVIGVSLPLLRELVGELGHAWPDLWTDPGDATR